MRRVGPIVLLCSLAGVAHAQDDAAPIELPAPTLEEEEPVAPAEPLPEPPEEEAPEILSHIGTGDHPEWEEENEEEVPRDIAFETPNDARSTQGTSDNPRGAQIYGTDPEQPAPPFVLAAGAGWARFLASTPLDFFRVEERFEATIPEFTTLRLGASATQMFNENGYIVGGGVRIGMGVPLCDTGDVVCEGLVFVQPGFLAGLIGARFDLDALLSLRLNLFRAAQVAVEGGYSLLFDGNSLLHVTGSVGFTF